MVNDCNFTVVGKTGYHTNLSIFDYFFRLDMSLSTLNWFKWHSCDSAIPRLLSGNPNLGYLIDIFGYL